MGNTDSDRRTESGGEGKGDENVERQEGRNLFTWVAALEQGFLKRFFALCFDTSITGKLMGILIVSLLGISVIFVQNNTAIRAIEKINQENLFLNIPQYKISQYILRRINGFKVALLYMLSTDVTAEEYQNHVVENRKRIYDMRAMLTTLQSGGVISDVARITGELLDRFSVIAVRNGSEVDRVNAAMLESLGRLELAFAGLSNPNTKNDEDAAEEYLDQLTEILETIHGHAVQMAVTVNHHQQELLRQSSSIMQRSNMISLLVGTVAATVLLAATLLYVFLIVSPLKNMLRAVRELSREEGDLTNPIRVRSHDEVGQLAHHLNQLTDNIHTINSFKSMIEEDETTFEIFQRLAVLLRERYGFEKLMIYEVPENKREMNLAFASDHNFVCGEDIRSDCSLCRALRTGHPISSFETPDICAGFPYMDTMEHYCIPMIAGGKVIAIVQLLHDKKDLAGREEFLRRIKRAKRYIKEATPVVEAKRFASTLKETTLKDPMTGLYNRRFLESYSDNLVATTLRRKTRVGILMCDLDFFKEVNDTHGHEAGDTVIIKLAEVLTQCVRTADLVIRYGGEEFLILCVDVDCRDALTELAERIRATMESTIIKLPTATLKKTISIGYAMFPEDSEGFWETIKFADVALYQAKDGGRNRTVGFQSEMWEGKSY